MNAADPHPPARPDEPAAGHCFRLAVTGLSASVLGPSPGWKISEHADIPELLAQAERDAQFADAVLIRAGSAGGLAGVCRALKASAPGVSVLLVAPDFAESDARAAALEAGAIAVVPEPVSARELAARLERTRLTKENERAASRREADLRARESLLFFAMDTGLVIIFEWDVAADAVRRMQSSETALPPTGERTERIADVIARIHPDDRERFRARIEASFGDPQGRYECLFRIVRPDGTIRWLSERGQTSFGPGGKPQKLVGISFDVTDRQQATEALEQANALLDTIFESAPLGLAAWDTDLRFVRVNRALAEINGLTTEAHIGKRPDELLPQVDLSGVYERWREVIATGKPWLDVELVGETPAAPGIVRSWVENFFPLRTGGRVTGIGAIVEETTEKKRVAEFLEQQARLLHQSLEPMIVWELGGAITQWNRGAEQLYGYSEEEVVGRRSHDVLRTVHPMPVDAFERMVGEKGVWMGELTQITKAGDTISVESRQEIMIGAGGRILVLETNRDITARKKAEQQIRLLMREVNHRSKNLLAVVQAVANQTAKLDDPEDFASRFGERLQGLAASHDLLVNNAWQGVDLRDLVTSQLSHFIDLIGETITIEGPPQRISAAAAQSLGMALHELTTNAGKYGALATEGGRLAIAWSVDGSVSPPGFRISWTETGCNIEPPKKKGFGSRVISDMARLSLGGTVSLDYPQSGLVWSLEAPLERFIEAPHAASGDDGAA